LIQVEDPVLANQSISYDAAGNRVTSGLVPKPGSGNPEQRTYSVNNLNQYLSVTSASSVVQLSYDLNGNLTQEVANGVVYGFRWDWENRLVGYSNSASGVSASYYYDPFGRRLRKVVNGVTNWYLYADEGLVEEMDGQGHEIRSYGYAPNSLWMNDPVYLRVATGQGTNVYYFLNDQLGAPQKLIARNGEVVWSMESEAFGKATVFSDSTVTNNLRFSSQYYDQESSLHYNTQRYYEPEVGRYLGRDPIEDEAFFRHYGQMKYQRELRRLRAQSLLPTYLFVWNSPMSFSDSRGLSVHSSGCGDCGPMADAINKVNAALNTGKCKQWFENHGYDYSGGTPSFAINCHSRCKLWCLFGGTAWTMPGMDIGFCESKCGSMSAIEIASILIHEIAHHYCTIGPGREDCAISAQDACVNALTGQEMDVPHKLLPVTP